VSFILTALNYMETTNNRTVIVYAEDEHGKWISLQDAARIAEMPDKTLYAAVYRAGKGRRPTIPHRYIKEHEGQRRRTLCVPIGKVIEYQAEAIVKDVEEVSASLKSVIQQHGVTEEEANAILTSYEKAFERVTREVRAKELEGMITSESIIVQ
jgi:hypothetical protein